MFLDGPWPGGLAAATNGEAACGAQAASPRSNIGDKDRRFIGSSHTSGESSSGPSCDSMVMTELKTISTDRGREGTAEDNSPGIRRAGGSRVRQRRTIRLAAPCGGLHRRRTAV